MASKNNRLTARTPRFNRFQTGVYGAWVATAMNAHFDPMAEAPARTGLTREEMEKVPELAIPEESADRGR